MVWQSHAARRMLQQQVERLLCGNQPVCQAPFQSLLEQGRDLRLIFSGQLPSKTHPFPFDPFHREQLPMQGAELETAAHQTSNLRTPICNCWHPGWRGPLLGTGGGGAVGNPGHEPKVENTYLRRKHHFSRKKNKSSFFHYFEAFSGIVRPMMRVF